MASRMRTPIAALLGTAVFGILSGPGLAQSQDHWPNRPIQLVVASSAGSGTDALARVMAKRLSESLKQPVVVENKPGAAA